MSYVSEEAKTAFAWRVGVLGAVCLFLQLFVPFIFFFTAFMIPMGTGIRMDRFDSAFFFNGSTYIVTNHMEAAPFQGREEHELVISRLDGEDLVRVASLENLPLEYASTSSIAEHEGKVWLFFSEGYVTFDGKEVSAFEPMEELGATPIAEEWKGDLVVLTYQDPDYRLIRRSQGRWLDPMPIDLNDKYKTRSECCGHFLIGRGDLLYFFRSYQGKLYYRWMSDSGLTEWTRVNGASYSAEAGADRQGLFIIETSADREGPFRSKISLMRLRDGEWTEPVEQEQRGMLTDIHTAVDEEGRAHIFGQSFMFMDFRTMMYTIEGDRIADPIKIGASGFPFFGKMMLLPYIGAYLVPILTTLIMAIGATIFMGRYRTGSHPTAAGPVPYASVLRRAVAQIVDLMIVNIPFAVLAAVLYKAGSEKIFTIMEEHFVFMLLGFFAFLGLFFIWGILYFTIPEGLWGLTPGKMLVKIRVLGEDMRPCGIGRALLRNILKIVDGFFNFLVGIIVVAFTENWQRVGDLVARTIVIHEKQASHLPHSPAQPAQDN